MLTDLRATVRPYSIQLASIRFIRLQKPPRIDVRSILLHETKIEKPREEDLRKELRILYQ
jgi:hypothetical protein